MGRKISCELGDEIERTNRANRRKRKALRELTKAIEERNELIKVLENYVVYLRRKIYELNRGVNEMSPKEHKDLQEKLNASRKFTAFEWFVLLLIVVLVVCLPLLAVIPQ